MSLQYNISAVIDLKNHWKCYKLIIHTNLLNVNKNFRKKSERFIKLFQGKLQNFIWFGSLFIELWIFLCGPKCSIANENQIFWYRWRAGWSSMTHARQLQNADVVATRSPTCAPTQTPIADRQPKRQHCSHPNADIDRQRPFL